jgi:hypothetical protein
MRYKGMSDLTWAVQSGLAATTGMVATMMDAKRFYAVFKDGQLVLLSDNSQIAVGKFLGSAVSLKDAPNDDPVDAADGMYKIDSLQELMNIMEREESIFRLGRDK